MTPQTDPLNSPHPVPWSWILANHAAAVEANETRICHYRSASLRSPLGTWSAYSHIRLEVSPDLTQSYVGSLLLVENLDSGTLLSIAASSPIAQAFWLDENGMAEAASDDRPGSNDRAGLISGLISMLLPVAWNQTGTKLLSRQFEGAFSSSMASDYAVVWEGETGMSRTLAPQNVAYERAILQGWSQNLPEQVLFETAKLGEPQRPLWTVDLQGHAVPAAFDQAQNYGDRIAHAYAGPLSSATRLPEA